MANIIIVDVNTKGAEVQDRLVEHSGFVGMNGLKKEDIVFMRNAGKVSLLGVITGGTGYDGLAKKGIANLAAAFKTKEVFEKDNNLRFHKCEVQGHSSKHISDEDFTVRLGLDDAIVIGQVLDASDEQLEEAKKMVEELKSESSANKIKCVELELK